MVATIAVLRCVGRPRRALADTPSLDPRGLVVKGDVDGLVSLTMDDLMVDLSADLNRLLRPVVGQVLFGHPEPKTPATTA